MAGMFGPLSFLGDEVVNKIGSTVVDEIPQNQFVKKTAEIANDTVMTTIEKIPILGDAIKIGKEKYEWSQDQIDSMLHGTADDIKHAFKHNEGDPVPHNAVGSEADHQFKLTEVKALTEAQVKAQETLHLNQVANNTAKSFAQLLTEHKVDFKRIAWNKLLGDLVDSDDIDFINSFELNPKTGFINKKAFGKLPPKIRKQFFDIMDSNKISGKMGAETHNMLTKGLSRAGLGKIKPPPTLRLPGSGPFGSGGIPADFDEDFGGPGDFEMQDLGPPGKKPRGGKPKLFDSPPGGKFDKQLTPQQLQLQKDA